MTGGTALSHRARRSAFSRPKTVSRTRLWLAGCLLVGVVLLSGALPAAADTTPQTLPFAQNWTNTGLITLDDNWSGVAGVIGYRGDAMAATTAVDPQTVLADGSGTPVDVNANRPDPNTFATGGVSEFHIADPVVALQGSGTARAPHLVLSVDTTGHAGVTVAYNLRDVDGAADNAVQPVALQYRVGGTGNYTNVPAGYVADATTGPSLATQVTPVNAVLPASADNQPLVQIRIITTDAVGSDEWVGIDDITVAEAPDVAPAVQTTTPANNATGVAVDANVSITFTEPVDVSGSWFSISCASSGSHTATASGGPTTFTLDPATNFVSNENCTVTVVAAQVTDQDTDDPPDAMEADYVFSFTTAAGPPPPGQVVVSEVYGGGGNSGATLTHDFIELYNRTGSAIDLTGWSVQYGSATGSTWQVTPLSGSIPAGRNYLVQEAQGAGGTTPLPTPDATGTIPMSATAGKVALVSTTTALTGSCPTGAAISDFVGYGTTANCFEGTGPTPAPSNTTSVKRNAGGSTDTDNNAADFTAGAPDPHGTTDPAPTVASTVPTGGATGVALDANITINFSEPVNVTGNWFTINCGNSGSHTAAVSGGPTSFTLDPDSNYAGNESCTVTVLAANVTDQDSDDPPDNMAANHVFSFQTADVLVCGASATLIHDAQGSGTSTPIPGSGVTIEGVVVGDYQAAGSFGGYYVQEEAADFDADPNTSEGVFVLNTAFAVAPGDLVRVRGTVSESFSLTQIGSVTALSICSTGNVVTPTSVSLPVGNLSVHEQTEGMLVSFSQTLTATEVFNLGRFGEVSLSGAGRLYTPTAVTTPGPAAIAQLDQNNRSRIILDDANNQQNIDPTVYPQGGLSASNTLRVGDSLSGLTGIMDFRFSNYRIQPVGPLSFTHTNPRPAAPAAVGGNLKVASFNVLNYFNGNGLGGGFPTSRGATTPAEFARQRDKIISALTAINADIVGLMEIENDAPPNSAIEDLVAGLNAAMGAGTYDFVNTGVIGSDEIKVALIYKPARVSLVGAHQIITSTTDPRFVDTLNRPSLAQTFQHANGERLTVVVNHLKSKGSACPGDPDTGDGQGNCNQTRTNAAAALVDWLASDPTGSGDPDFLVIGDLNSYTFEDPITTFTNGGFTNLVGQFNGLTAYSYVFNGESGYLDHALASPSMAAQATGTTEWHINPDEPIALDYNVEFKSANQVNTYYSPDPYRSSDHDPIIVGLGLDAAPTVDAGGPYTVPEGGSVGLTASGNDPDGGTLTYAWDLDNNGSFETPGQNATFSAAGLDGPISRTVVVQITDDGGNTSTDQATVNVTNADPTATFNAPATTFAGFPFTISLTSPSDPAPADTFTYSFDCGDGSGFGAATTSNSRSCPTSDTGTRTVRGRITDDDGGSTTYTKVVSVQVTHASLCQLTREYSSDPKTADSLCKKLADAAGTGGKGPKQEKIQAYIDQVQSKRGKDFTNAEADTLIRLANRL